MGVSAQAQDFVDLNTFEQSHLIRSYKHLHILRGLRDIQNARLLRLKELLGQNEAPEDSALLYEARHLFNLNRLVVDLGFEFESELRPPTYKGIQSLYRRQMEALQKSHRSYVHVREFLDLSESQETYLLKNPFLGKLDPFYGLRGESLRQFIRLRYGEATLIENLALFQKLETNQELALEEFLSYIQIVYPHQNMSLHSSFRAYFQYLAFSQLVTRDALPLESREAFDEHIETSKNKLIPLIEEYHLEDFGNIILEFQPKQLDLVWIVYQTILQNRDYKIDWLQAEVLEADDEKLMGLLWLQKFYGQKWTKFLSETEIEDLIQSGNRDVLKGEIERIKSEILEYLQTTAFEPVDDEDFLRARDQIENGDWVDEKNSLFRLLKPEIQNLLAIYLFPNLALRYSRALLEKRFASLKGHEQYELLQTIYQNSEQRVDIDELLKTYSLHDPEQTKTLHQILVSDYFKYQDENLTPPEESGPQLLHLIESGEAIPLASFAREEAREQLRALAIQQSGISIEGWSQDKINKFLEENPASFDGGWDPLVRWLYVNVTPYPGFFEDEKKRFLNEQKRQEIIDIYYPLFEALEERYLAASSPEEKQAIENEREKLTNELTGKYGEDFNYTDLGSAAVYASAFYWGAKKDPLHVAGLVALGSGFALVTKFVPGKYIVYTIILDTGVRVITARMEEEGSVSFWETDFEKGVSTPLGKWTIQTAQHALQILAAFAEPTYPMARLNATSAFGALASDLFYIWGGAKLTNAVVPVARMGRIQKSERMKSEISKLSRQKHLVEAEIKGLQAERKLLLEERVLLHDQMPLARKLDQQITGLNKQIDLLQNGVARGYEGSLRFYLGQAWEVVFEVGRFAAVPINLFRPTRIWGTLKQVGAIGRNSLRRYRNRGVQQIQRRILKLQEDISFLKIEEARLQSDGGFLNRFKNAFKWRLRGKEKFTQTLKDYRGKLDSSATHLERAYAELAKLQEAQRRAAGPQYSHSFKQKAFAEAGVHLEKLTESLVKAQRDSKIVLTQLLEIIKLEAQQNIPMMVRTHRARANIKHPRNLEAQTAYEKVLNLEQRLGSKEFALDQIIQQLEHQKSLGRLTKSLHREVLHGELPFNRSILTDIQTILAERKSQTASLKEMAQIRQDYASVRGQLENHRRQYEQALAKTEIVEPGKRPNLSEALSQRKLPEQIQDPAPYFRNPHTWNPVEAPFVIEGKTLSRGLRKMMEVDPVTWRWIELNGNILVYRQKASGPKGIDHSWEVYEMQSVARSLLPRRHFKIELNGAIFLD